MNMLPDEAIRFIDELTPLVKDTENEVILCVPYTDLFYSLLAAQNTNIKIGAQNMHWEESGAYTGEVSGRMLKVIGVEYVIIGHSERRNKFKETDKVVNKKIKTALASGLKVILCVGENLTTRQSKQAATFVKKQLDDCLKGIYENELESIIIAYEPIWAIGTGKTATVKDIQSMTNTLRKEISYLYSDKAGEQVNIVYGGSVDIVNYKKILILPCLNGVLIGGASLNVDNFAVVCRENY